MMVVRLLITLVIAGGLGLLWLLWQVYKGRLIQTLQPGEEVASLGQATLLYFTGAYCQICKHHQAPIIEELAARFGSRVTVHTYDVSTQPELARRYKVLTLPTTVVVSAEGQAVAINYGLAPRQKLAAQLAQAAGQTAGPVLAGSLQQVS